MKKSILVRLFLLIFACSGTLSAFSQSFNAAKLDSLMQLLSDNNKVMGSFTIRKDKKVVYQNSLGYADMNEGSKVKSGNETRYRVGSVSKMFTSVMIFQLIEEKKLSLGTTLSTWFPEIPNADKINIKNMLNHHSGIHNFTDDEEYLGWYTESRSQQQMLDLIKKPKPDFEPGSKASYSNSNYVLLGYIIEKITKKDYSVNLKERITDKIQLKDTYYGGKTDLSKNECYSYSCLGKEWIKEKETDMSIPHGAGSVVSTTADLTSFIHALFNEQLISKKSLEEMMKEEDNYGKGIFSIPFHEMTAYGHNGGIDGFQSSLAYFPKDGLALAFCGNGLNYSMNDVLLGTLSIYYGRSYTLPSFKTIDVSAEILNGYEGIYSSSGFPLKITIKKEGTVLTAQATNQSAFPLEAVSETEFKFDGAGIVLSFNKSSNEMTLKQGGGMFVFKKE
jgi:D-alanyl-D-alanine carboxypeptidase